MTGTARAAAEGEGEGAGALAELLDRVAGGRPPPADGLVSVLPPPWTGHHHAVLGFTAHHVVVTDAAPAWVHSLLPPGDLSAPLKPPFLAALSERTGRRVGSVDLVTVARALEGPAPLPLTEVGGGDHPRVLRALDYRDGVRAWATAGGVVVVGRGVAGRWEAAVEVDEAARGRGLGRALATAARHLVPRGEPVWAQIAPGNAASVRAFLAAGYSPVGAEALLVEPA